MEFQRWNGLDNVLAAIAWGSLIGGVVIFGVLKLVGLGLAGAIIAIVGAGIWVACFGLSMLLLGVAIATRRGLTRSPLAVGVAFGPQAALEIVDRLREVPALDGYHLLPSVRGDLLEKLGRLDEARPECERAALLTANSRQRAALLERAAASASHR
jgi:hypothetical protein